MNHLMRIGQNGPGPTDPAGEPRGNRDPAGLDTSAPGIASRSIVGPSSVLLVLVGGGMLGYANGTVDALLVAFVLLLLGVASCSLVFPHGGYECRAFMLSYGMCALVAGAVHCYSLYVFGSLHGTIDGERFFGYLQAEPPYWTLEELKTQMNPVLAILLWQRIYAVAMAFGMDFGPYIGVLFNALTVGLSGAVTVCAARELFGDDDWRLLRVGTLFACCGMFWLFGGLLLRDCFTLFLNTLVFWALVRWLRCPNIKSLLTAVGVVAFSCCTIVYLRPKSEVLFGIFACLAFFCWYWKAQLNLARLFATVGAIGLLLFANCYVEVYVKATAQFAASEKEAYVEISEAASSVDSLGIALVNRQPLPIRLVLGSGRMMITPIPVWAYIRRDVLGYHLLMTYQAVYSILILPLVFLGWKMAVWPVLKRREGLGPEFFVAAYALGTLFAVVMTSLDNRHLGQFMPAMLLLAAMPDTREPLVRRRVRAVMVAWFAAVIAVHLAWATMRGG